MVGRVFWVVYRRVISNSVTVSIDDHPIVQVGDARTAGLFEQEWQKRVNRTRESTKEHPTGEEHRVSKMFKIGFIGFPQMSCQILHYTIQ